MQQLSCGVFTFNTTKKDCCRNAMLAVFQRSAKPPCGVSVDHPSAIRWTAPRVWNGGPGGWPLRCLRQRGEINWRAAGNECGHQGI